MANAQDVPGSSQAAAAAPLPVHDRFQELTREHHSLDQRLLDLASMSYLTDAQHVEEVTLKKRKLAIKDQMAALLASSRR